MQPACKEPCSNVGTVRTQNLTLQAEEEEGTVLLLALPKRQIEMS
jgi:hypothetical protein